MPTTDERIAALTAATEHNTTHIARIESAIDRIESAIEPMQRAITRMESAIEENARHIRQLATIAEQTLTTQDEMKEMLRWLVRTVQFHEQRLDRLEGQRPA
jgi:chromosome segregation ATPase